MQKPGYVSLDRSGVNKEAMAKDQMPDFAGFDAFINPTSKEQEEYRQDEPAPEKKQESPDVRKAQPISTPDRYY